MRILSRRIYFMPKLIKTINHTSLAPLMICFKKYTLVVSIGGRQAWQSCRRKLNSSFFDFIFALNQFTFTDDSCMRSKRNQTLSSYFKRWVKLFAVKWVSRDTSLIIINNLNFSYYIGKKTQWRITKFALVFPTRSKGILYDAITDCAQIQRCPWILQPINEG